MNEGPLKFNGMVVASSLQCGVELWGECEANCWMMWVSLGSMLKMNSKWHRGPMGRGERGKVGWGWGLQVVKGKVLVVE